MKNGAPTKVVLLNGEITDTWSNAWREECLARKPLVDHVLGLLGKHNRPARDSYYQWIGAMYGAEQEKRVREAVSRVWKLEGDRIKENTK
jgi:hypothetical protein